ncbi:MAG: CdaR family protein [Clostridia bacterium]|jgi:YbbR domain-containing protein
MWEKIKHNLFFKILSVLIAILAWFTVSVNNNPVESRTITVPIQVINEKSLIDKNLEIVDDYVDYIEIDVKGASTEISQVTVSDFTAFLDLSRVTREGETVIAISDIAYKGSSKITFTYDDDAAKIHIEAEQLVSAQFPVTVEFTGELPSGYSVVSYTVTPSIQSINNVSSTIENVGKIAVKIDLNDVQQSFTLRKTCVIYDKSDNVINEFSNLITVDVGLVIGKTVDVTEVLTGSDNIGDDHIFISSTLDVSKMIIVGEYDVIKDIDAIYTQPFDISGRTESFISEAILNVASNITVYYEDNILNTGNTVKLSVTIEKLTTKVFEYAINELTIRNKSVSHGYTLNNDMFTVTLKGRAQSLALITKSSLTPYIDVININDGSYNLKVKVLSMGGSITLIDSSSVNVYVETVTVLTIPSEKIVFTNTSSGYMYTTQVASFNIKVIGLGDAIAQADINRMQFYVSVQDMGPGMYLLDLVLKDGSLPAGVRIFEDSQIAVKISN